MSGYKGVVFGTRAGQPATDRPGWSSVTVTAGVCGPDVEMHAMQSKLEAEVDAGRSEVNARIRAAIEAAKPSADELGSLKALHAERVAETNAAVKALAAAEAEVTAALRAGSDPSDAEAEAETQAKALRVSKKRAAKLEALVAVEAERLKNATASAARLARGNAIVAEGEAVRRELEALSDELGAAVADKLPRLLKLRAMQTELQHKTV